MANDAQYPAIIVSSASARICAPTGLERERRGEQIFAANEPRAEQDRVSANDNETRELRKQVDSLVELLGHHGVRLDSRSGMSNEPPRPPAQQVPSASSYVNTELPPQLNYDQTFQSGSTSMPLPQLGYSSGSSQHVVNDQDRLVQQPFDNNAWTQSPVEQIQDGIVRHTVVSPPNEASHGTLVISASGRSKYLGPSAASEWLKDVS
jgi:hypothetical protein